MLNTVATRTKSEHQMEVEAFMLRMRNDKQAVPLEPTIPDNDTLILRAKLIFEEAMETIEALGVTIQLKEFVTEPYVNASHPAALHDPSIARPTLGKYTVYEFFRDARKDPNLVEIVDGCCDLKVVTTGTLSACGVSDVLPQRIVDTNNLAKFAPGHMLREDGKLIKPPSHRPCTEDLKFILRQMLSDPSGLQAERLGLYGSPYAATVERAESRSAGDGYHRDQAAQQSGQGPLNLD